MIFNPHPIVMTKMAEQRRADFHAWADGYRLARRAEQRAELRAGTDLAPVIAVVVALALLAIGSAAAQESLPQDLPGLVQTAGDPETTAVQKAREAA
jgi:hypothetical protein